MPPSSFVAMVTGNPVLRGVGSLWFAAVLLMLFLVAMACATVCESLHTRERAMVLFYTSWWFKTILVLIAANVLASMVVRYPFSRRQIGFLLTHTGILVTLGGALVTDRFGVGGQIGLFEGESVDAFNAGTDVLVVANRRDQARASVDLAAQAFSGPHAMDRPDAPVLTLDELRFIADHPRQVHELLSLNIPDPAEHLGVRRVQDLVEAGERDGGRGNGNGVHVPWSEVVPRRVAP